MYAVFQSGGKQHRVSEGQVVRLEKLELATGSTVEFDSVLMVVNGEDEQTRFNGYACNPSINRCGYAESQPSYFSTN